MTVGRLTLNPIPHIDLIFTILLPLFLIVSHSGFIFGGAKPVPVDVKRLRRPRRDWALVGAAGPAMNVLIAILLTAVFWAATLAGVAAPTSSLAEILAIGIYLNALLALFNLVPIPPLDGSRIVQYFLSGESLVLYRRIEQYGLFIIMGLIFFVPVLQAVLGAAIFGLGETRHDAFRHDLNRGQAFATASALRPMNAARVQRRTSSAPYEWARRGLATRDRLRTGRRRHLLAE